MNPDPTLPLNPDPAKKKKPKPCGWAVIDVHIATPNGISNHLYVETDVKPTPPAVKNVVMTATTTTTAEPAQHRTTTSTKVEATPPGMALPPLTVLPLGTQWPANTVMAQGSVTGVPPGSVYPGMINPPAAAAARSAAGPEPVGAVVWFRAIIAGAGRADHTVGFTGKRAVGPDRSANRNAAAGQPRAQTRAPTRTEGFAVTAVQLDEARPVRDTDAASRRRVR